MSFTFPMAGAAILIGALRATFEPTTFVGSSGLIAGLLGSGFLVCRTLWGIGAKKFKKRITQLMEAVSETVEDAARLSGSTEGRALPPGPEQEQG